MNKINIHPKDALYHRIAFQMYAQKGMNHHRVRSSDLREHIIAVERRNSENYTAKNYFELILPIH